MIIVTSSVPLVNSTPFLFVGPAPGTNVNQRAEEEIWLR